MRSVQTPEGLFIYDRETGICLHTPEVKSKVWLKPLYAQVAVTSRCNMRCWWCYASSSPEGGAELSLEDLKDLIAFLDRWGLLGVAFGGGEPFLHPRLVDIVKWTWQNTGLDISITTNGSASERQIRAIEGFVGEVRVSIRTVENCALLGKFAGRKFDLGVNLLLFRNGVSKVEKLIAKCLKMGINDFLINDFRAVGRGIAYADREPAQADFNELAATIAKLQDRATFKVSSRLARSLGGGFKFVPFSREDVGCIIAVTADKKVKPTSLSPEEHPFQDPYEIPEIYNHFVSRGGDVHEV